MLFAADRLSVTSMRLEQRLQGMGDRVVDRPLTRLLSRRELMRRLPRLVDGDVICVIDVDDFRAVNDRVRQVVGDPVLRA
ncbi:MAG: hypothetical protein NVS3B26_02210 [Mycobacteriales bacterium]